jgi:hypothetical protein
MIHGLLKNLLVIFSCLIIVACGGGGGGGGGSTTPTAPIPTVNLSAEPTSVLLESTSTLTWSSTNATSCSATWTSQAGSSGSEAVTISTVGNNSFSISCTGDGGTRSASVTVEGYRETDGVVVDGYISGAEVCIDENDNWTCDSSENSTTSDNDGTFTIRYANGNLVSIGGTDLDSQTLLDNLLITHKLTGHSDFKAVTPVTSIAAFMEDASLVNAALGIDSSIDVFTFDPVANKGDGGINDFLYEKGNQLTVLAFALQNITNNLNTTTETTQDYFKAITEEIEKEYTETETKVDIETEAFVTKVFDNVITAKSVTIDETAKANTAKALAGVMPIIEVKSSDDLTTGVIRFAVSTLQTDMQDIANGTATAETVSSYTEDVLAYIAEDQNIDADEITPDISAIADSATTSEDTAVTINVLLNDSYLTSAPISVTAGNGSNGATILAESYPEQVLYTPNSDFNGTDSFSYTITQGDKTSSADVTVTIEAVNDEPTIDIASTIKVAENQTAVTTVSVSDGDDDELTLTLGGTDADSFNLSSDNVLTFKEAPNYEVKNKYSISLILTDGTETLQKDIDIVIDDVNDAPIITNLDPIIKINENLSSVIQITAIDEDGDEICFNLTGEDKDLFQVDQNENLIFSNAPDYEVPLDVGGNNKYNLSVSASNSCSSTIGQDIRPTKKIKLDSEIANTSVEVQNVDEDLIDFNLSSTPGTSLVAPKIIANFQIDSLTFAQEVQLLLENPSGTQFWIYSGLNTNNGINWQIQKELSTLAPAGVYKTRALRIVRSNQLDDLAFTPEAIIGKGLITNVDVENSRQDINLPEISDITSIDILQNDGDENTPIVVKVNALVADVSGIKEARIFVKSPGGQTRDYTASINTNNALFEIELDPRAASGTYLINRFIIEDNAGNSKTYSNSELEDLEIINKWSLDNSIGDNDAPTINSLSLIDKIDASDFNRKIIKVSVTTDAQESEIERIYIRLKHSSEDIQIDEDFPSENFIKDASAYALEFAIPFEYPSGKYEVDYIWIKDKALNESNYDNSAIKSNNWDAGVEFGNRYAFEGKTIDGYIAGAQVFIDENFNFKFDEGELSGVTDNEGNLKITLDDEARYACLVNRPIVANVNVGAIDLSSGVINKSYEMVLPSIKDTGNDKIVISPFTNLLADAIIQGKVASSIKDEIPLSESCGEIADSISTSISSEINQITSSIGQSLGITYGDLLNDFIATTTSTAINEQSARSIAEFFKYFKTASDLFDAELSAIHNKSINTDLAIKEDSINTILANPSVQQIPMNFSAIYRTDPNAAGWFIEEKIDSKGANLNRNGDIIHHTCFGDSKNCKTSNLTLESLRDASERYYRTSSFINNSYDADGYNYILNTEDSQIVYYNIDGSTRDRTCIYQNWLYLTPKNSRENFTSNDRYNTGKSTGTTEDKCKPVEDNLTKSLFIALVDTYDDGVSFEELDVRITNPNYLNSEIIKNKVSDIYENRNNLNIDPLITELSSIPRNFKDLNIIRNKLGEDSSDQVSIFWTKRNSSGQQTELARISIKFNPDDDEFTYGTFVNSDTGSEYTEVISTKGQTARDDLFATISSKSNIFGSQEFVGSSPVTDNRITISGKTIDGYVEGANVFFDVNFNQRLDAGEYSATTNENGFFEIRVNAEDESCVKARPIIADVPVGANDSSLGEVTKAYQMVLPSVNDAGSNQIVISPFTSLIGEAILKGKNSSDLSEDLSVAEGCAAAGDAVAENISTEVSSLINEIESAFNVTWEDLISDFIASGGTSNITEDIAAKVAAFFPYYKEIKDEISSELTSRYNKDVTPNVSLSKDALEAILFDGEFTELPLEFFSVYQTSPNAQGFYNIDEISSTGATITANGELKRHLCTLNNSADCDITGLTLNGVGNASKSYIRQVNINNDNYTVDGVDGNINIRGSDSRGLNNIGSNPESFCESEETIQFVGPQDSKGLQMEYRYGFGRYANNLKDCAALPDYGPAIRLRIEKQGRGDNFPDASPTWALQFMINNHGTSRLTESKVFNIIDNDQLDPEELIKEVAALPAGLSQINEMRKLLSYGESAFYYYSPNTGVDMNAGEPFVTYGLQLSSVPRDDQFYHSEDRIGVPSQDIQRLGGQAARDAIFNIMSGSDYDYDGFIGESAPVSNILFEYESQGIQFADRLIDGKNRDYRVYPRLNSTTNWIDASLVGSEISKASMDAFINGEYTTNTNFFLGLNVDAPFTSVEEFNLKIFSNNIYSSSSEHLDLTVELKIETLPSGALQVTWLDQGKVTFKFVDGDVSITKTVINNDGDITRSIPKGNYTFEDFDFLKSLLDKVRGQFESPELQLIKDFFKSGSDYSYKIDLGAYAILDDYDQTSSIIAGTFGIADTPMNSIYSYKNNIIFGEGTVEDICFDTAWTAEEDISFNIKPTYRNKPGYMTAEEVNFSSTSVTIEKGTSQKCVTFSSSVDDKLQEKQEFIEFEIDNVVNAKSGRNIPTRLTVQDD